MFAQLSLQLTVNNSSILLLVLANVLLRLSCKLNFSVGACAQEARVQVGFGAVPGQAARGSWAVAPSALRLALALSTVSLFSPIPLVCDSF